MAIVIKRICTLLLAAVLLLCLTGCGADNSVKTPAKPCEDVIAAVLEATPATDITVTVTYSDELYDDNFDLLYDFNKSFIEDGAIAYADEGVSADEISLFVVKDKNDAGLLKTALVKRIEERKRDFTGYAPDEVQKLEYADIITNGRYVVLLVGDNIDAMRTAFQNAVRPES